jgi:hypothetical protein
LKRSGPYTVRIEFSNGRSGELSVLLVQQRAQRNESTWF